MIHATLHLENGDTDLKLLEFNIPAVIGRSKIADVTIPHPLISRKHCELTEANDGRVVLRDLDSLNGTYVGEIRIKQMMLMPNDRLTIGPFTYRIEYEPATTEEEQTESLSNGNPNENAPTMNGQNEVNETVFTPGENVSPVNLSNPTGVKGSSPVHQASAAKPIEVPDFGDRKVQSISPDDEALRNFLKKLS
ncbi:MAG: FHA domain-containing protein [Pirellulales bacterium]|nr:FHA domain-containing protein [Pirellulales bacterium]